MVVGSWSLYAAMTGASASAATLGATATITDPTTNLPLASGGSQTQFTVDLPASAACSGDTATDGYHVFSYLLPESTAVTSDTFVGGFPSEGLGLFDSTGYYGSADTAVTTGQIVDIPTNFEFYYLTTHGQTAATLDGGSSETWQAGLACANSSGAVSDYWVTQVTFTGNSGDPGGFVWSAVPGVGTTTTTTTGASTSTSTSTSTTLGGGTTTTLAGGTTTTLAGGTTTTLAGGTTTTSAGGTTTTLAGGTTTTGPATGASGSTDSGNSGSSSGSTTPTTASATSLPFTGGQITRDLALGLLCIGFGFILLGFSVKVRRDIAPKVFVR
jgi:hypothetical protein